MRTAVPVFHFPDLTERSCELFTASHSPRLAVDVKAQFTCQWGFCHHVVYMRSTWEGANLGWGPRSAYRYAIHARVRAGHTSRAAKAVNATLTATGSK
jgi:hypothetical protein